MTDFTMWAAQRSAIRWLASKRFITWLWRWRWPGCPITVVIILTAILHDRNVKDGDLLDKIILADIVVFLMLLLTVVVLGTEKGDWSERTTGLLLFTVADLMIYGYLTYLPLLGIQPPFATLAKSFLRSNLVVGPFLLVLSYSDWLWLRIKIRRMRQRRR